MGFHLIESFGNGIAIIDNTYQKFTFHGGTQTPHDLVQYLFKNPTSRQKLINESTGQTNYMVSFLQRQILIGYILKPDPKKCSDHYFFFGKRGYAVTNGVFVGSENYGGFIIEHSHGKGQ